jgi:hypothetical protein
VPKQSLKISSFHSGLNSKSDPRDIKDDELAISKNAYVDAIGKITLSGATSTISTTGLDLTSLADGYGLFRFSSDYASDASEERTDYIIVWDDTNSKFYWLPSGTTAWDSPSWLDVSADWATGETSIPVYYFVDGALRISDGELSNDNPSKWVGVVDRTLFPDERSSGSKKLVISPVWKQQSQELKAPLNGTISTVAPAAQANINPGGIAWRVRNLREETAQIYDFTDDNQNPGGEDVYAKDEPYGAQSNDESWQTDWLIDDGYADSSAHAFGFAMFDEDDDASNNWDWLTNTGSYEFNDNDVTFNTGQSLYCAVRMSGEPQKQMWLGTHYQPHYGDDFLSMSVDDATISFINSDASEMIKFHIDPTVFTDSTTNAGEWHIMEFPYDEPYQTDVSGAITISRLHLELSVSWTRGSEIHNVGGRNASYKGEPFIELSDLRIGESELVGVKTVGKQKFSMSYTYDDKENESLLYDFGGANEIVLANTTSAYKIGIDAYIKQPTNYRVTGANLYIDDDGVPYRIAECRYTKGLRGSWESEFPATLQFDEVFSSGSWKSALIKTDGLPLLESYEAMNGFSPQMKTITAGFKSAAVQNRQVYIGSVRQDGQGERGDRMIKSATNSFDVFPTEGREIDVVINDGDDIIKLESYADRILQFKRNVMYLLNATRSSEYLEDTHFGKGISNSGAVTKTDKGIAWANKNGCYFYDGEQVHNLTDNLIKDDDWSTHINDSTDVTYSPIKNKIMIGGGTSNVDLYEFSFVTKSWVYSTGKFVTTAKTNFIIDIDEDIKWCEGQLLKKWDNSPSGTSALKILSRDFDFGSPATRKKCLKFYITYKADAATNVEVRYGTNGLDLTDTATGDEVSTAGVFAGTDTSCYNDTDGLISTGGEWKQAELKPSTSTNNIYSVQVLFLATGAVPSSFEINDLTVVYRPKPLK